MVCAASRQVIGRLQDYLKYIIDFCLVSDVPIVAFKLEEQLSGAPYKIRRNMEFNLWK